MRLNDNDSTARQKQAPQNELLHAVCESYSRPQKTRDKESALGCPISTGETCRVSEAS